MKNIVNKVIAIINICEGDVDDNLTNYLNTPGSL